MGESASATDEVDWEPAGAGRRQHEGRRMGGGGFGGTRGAKVWRLENS